MESICESSLAGKQRCDFDSRDRKERKKKVEAKINHSRVGPLPISFKMDEHWKRSQEDHGFFFKLLSIINGETDISRKWKENIDANRYGPVEEITSFVVEDKDSVSVYLMNDKGETIEKLI